MDSKELARKIVEVRDAVHELTEELNQEQDEEKLAIRNALFSANNALVNSFWEVMIYREKKGLPVPSPHY